MCSLANLSMYVIYLSGEKENLVKMANLSLLKVNFLVMDGEPKYIKMCNNFCQEILSVSE